MLKIRLTARDSEGTLLPVQRIELQVHRTCKRQGDPEKKKIVLVKYMQSEPPTQLSSRKGAFYLALSLESLFPFFEEEPRKEIGPIRPRFERRGRRELEKESVCR